MRALVVSQPNVFAVQDVERPAPGPHEVLCKVRAIAICGTDPHIIQGHYPGFWPQGWPLVPGHEWCGDVVELGPGAADFGWEVGTRVAGTSHAACGFCRKCVEGRYNLCERFGDLRVHQQYGHNVDGAYAEYVVHSIKSVFAVPDELAAHRGAGPDLSAAQLLADRGVLAAGSDTETFEVQPAPDRGTPANPQPVHTLLLIERGIYILESLDLERLARAGVREFLFVALPLSIRGATGSMLDPVAIT